MTREFVCAATAVAFAALVGGDVFSILTAVSMAFIESFVPGAGGLGIAMTAAAVPSVFLAGWLARNAYRTEMLLAVSTGGPGSMAEAGA